MKYIIPLCLILVLLGGCVSPDAATKTLAAQGYTDIQINDFSPILLFRCSEDDQIRTPFTAVSPAGVQVDGVVCSGFMKGSTIRFN